MILFCLENLYTQLPKIDFLCKQCYNIDNGTGSLIVMIGTRS